jgi:hypothetical protein
MKAWIREYKSLVHAAAQSAPGVVNLVTAQVAKEPGADQAPITFSASVQSASFGADTRFIAIISDAAFHYVVGDDPVATTNALRVPADTPLYLGVDPGGKIAVIAAD